MLLVIMTNSLIRLDNTVRASLDSNCMTNRMTNVNEIEMTIELTITLV